VDAKYDKIAFFFRGKTRIIYGISKQFAKKMMTCRLALLMTSEMG
jgi:hypothetical protein